MRDCKKDNSIFSNKVLGQSAIEYLMTYGWMLLVVAVVGGAIFSITGSQSIESTSGFSGGDVSVENFGLSEDSLDFILRNSAAEEIAVNSVEVADPETGLSNQVDIGQKIPTSETRAVEVPGIEQSDASKSLDVEVNYDTGGLSNLTISGTVSGTLEVYNRLSLEKASFNRSTDKLTIGVKNKGQDSTNSITYTVESNNTDYTGNLNNLDSGETEAINISIDKTYSLELINLDVEGPQFTDSNSGLQCTPTEGLVGYWTFNNEQTQNGYAIDLSKEHRDGSIGTYVKTDSDGVIGSSYDLSSGQVDTSALNGANLSEFTVLFWNKISSSSNNRLFIRKPWVGDGGFLGYISSPPQLIFASQSDSGNRVEGPSSNLEYGEWIFHAYRFNGSEVSLWLDGQLKQSEAQDSTFSASNGFNIGPGKAGLIDEVRVYNRSLSQGEIQRLYEVRSKDWAVSGCKLSD